MDEELAAEFARMAAEDQRIRRRPKASSRTFVRPLHPQTALEYRHSEAARTLAADLWRVGRRPTGAVPRIQLPNRQRAGEPALLPASRSGGTPAARYRRGAALDGQRLGASLPYYFEFIMGDIGKPIRETERPAPVPAPEPEPEPDREPPPPREPEPVEAQRA